MHKRQRRAWFRVCIIALCVVGESAIVNWPCPSGSQFTLNRPLGWQRSFPGDRYSEPQAILLQKAAVTWQNWFFKWASPVVGVGLAAAGAADRFNAVSDYRTDRGLGLLMSLTPCYLVSVGLLVAQA